MKCKKLCFNAPKCISNRVCNNRACNRDTTRSIPLLREPFTNIALPLTAANHPDPNKASVSSNTIPAIPAYSLPTQITSSTPNPFTTSNNRARNATASIPVCSNRPKITTKGKLGDCRFNISNATPKLSKSAE